LNFTIEASIKLLENLAKDNSKPELGQSHNLLYFLGCLPGGVNMEQLKLMWKNVEECKKVLDDLSLLEQGVTKVVLLPQLINHVELSIDQLCRANYMEIISESYTELLSEFYRLNSFVELKVETPNTEGEQTPNITSFTDTIQWKAKSSNDKPQMKTIFEKVGSELRNMEHCLNYFMDYSM